MHTTKLPIFAKAMRILKLKNGRLPASVCSPIVSHRLAHTDIKIPDWTFYRRSFCKDPKDDNREKGEEGKALLHLVPAVEMLGFVYATKSVVIQYVTFMAASAEVLALATIEIKLAEIPEGKTMTYKWRGKANSK